jgi:5'-nucleotidase/UDP-sugar diphosphatase
VRSIQSILIFALFATLVFFPLAQANDNSVRIIYISNKPNIEKTPDEGGFSELATFLKGARESNSGTLFLHGGDSLGPSLLSSFDRGSHMMDVLNALEADAMAVAQREFSYYEDELTLRTSEADFPILSANIFDPLSNDNLEGVISGYIFESNGHAIGVTSIVSEEVIANYLPKRISLLDADQSVRKASAQLRSDGAEQVILLTDHESPLSESWLNDAVVDLLIATSDLDTDEDKYQTINDRLLVTKGWNKGEALDIKLDFLDENGKSSARFKAESVDLSKYKPDKLIEEQIAQHLKVLSVLLDKKLGVFGADINTRRHFVRTEESQLGNFIADALKTTFNVDIGFFNGGSIRGDRFYKKGEAITRKTLQQEIPFRDSVAILEVSGAQILTALENGFSQIENVRGRFPQVSGIQVKMSPTEPVGNRVLSVTINGQPLDKAASYRLATTSFLASGGDGYDSFQSAKRLNETVGEQIIADVVSEFILIKKIVSPKIEGRISQVNNQKAKSSQR